MVQDLEWSEGQALLLQGFLLGSIGSTPPHMLTAVDPILRHLTPLMYCIGSLGAQLKAVDSIRQQ